jgi:hypothetical protein
MERTDELCGTNLEKSQKPSSVGTTVTFSSPTYMAANNNPLRRDSLSAVSFQNTGNEPSFKNCS